MYLIGYKLSSSRFWCLLNKTEKWGGMCRIGTEFFVYVFFCGWGRFPPRPSRARPTPSAGSPPPRNAPYRCHAERHADENQHRIVIPHVIPAKAGSSFFSSKGALVILALLRSADCCASELVTQVTLVTASLGLVVFHAANGKTVFFIMKTFVSCIHVITQFNGFMPFRFILKSQMINTQIHNTYVLRRKFRHTTI